MEREREREKINFSSKWINREYSGSDGDPMRRVVVVAEWDLGLIPNSNLTTSSVGRIHHHPLPHNLLTELNLWRKGL